MGKIKALITSVGGGVAQSIIKSLHYSGLEIDIIGIDNNPFSPGFHFCDRSYIIAPFTQPNYVEELLQIISNEKPDILFPGNDYEMPHLTKLRSTIKDLGCFPVVNSHENSKIIRNKLACYHYFRDHNFPYAATVPVSEIATLYSQVGLPLIVKPVLGAGSAGISIINNLASLHQAQSYGDNYIAQDYLIPATWNLTKKTITDNKMSHEGGAIKQVDEISIQVIVSLNGHILGVFMSKNELKAGFPMKIIPFHDDKMKNLTTKIARHLYSSGFIGPCNFQGKLTASGPVFFELNHRFTGITGMRAFMGFNECEAVIRDIVLKEPADSIANNLTPITDLACARYVTEAIFSKADLATASTTGALIGQGFSTHL